MLARYLVAVSFIAAIASANYATPPELRKYGLTSNKLLEAAINRQIDAIIPDLQAALKSYDPMNIPDVTYTKYLVIRFQLRRGFMEGLSTIQRMRDSKISYADRKLSFDVTLGWNKLYPIYSAFWMVFITHCSGTFNGEITGLSVNVGISADLNNYEIIFDKLNIDMSDIGGGIQGGLKCWLTNDILNNVIKSMKSEIANQIQTEATTIFKNYVDKLNAYLESHKSRKFTFVNRVPFRHDNEIPLDLEEIDFPNVIQLLKKH